MATRSRTGQSWPKHFTDPSAKARHPMATRSHTGHSRPKHFTDGTIRYPLPVALAATIVTDFVEPICFSQAFISEWRAAIVRSLMLF